MKNILLNVLNEYLLLFPDEKERQLVLNEFLMKYQYLELTDWNNFHGHIVASGFIYSKENSKFLIPLVPTNFTASGILLQEVCKEKAAEFTSFNKSADNATSELISEAISESFASLLLSIELI